MKVLHVSTFDRGGAATACIRLHEGLMQYGVDSRVLVYKRSKNYASVFEFGSSRTTSASERRARRALHLLGLHPDPVKSRDEIFKERFRQRLPPQTEYFSFPDSSFDITESALYKDADIIHLHWVSGFLDYASFFLKNKKATVWTLHDMEPFQGGFHYNGRFLGIDDEGKPSEFPMPADVMSIVSRNLEIKLKSFFSVRNLTLVAPSTWLKNASSNSKLFGRFKHHCIPYGVNSSVFIPRNKQYSKEVFGFPEDRLCFLFVSDDVSTSRKGFRFLQEALADVDSNKIFLCAVGTNTVDFFASNVCVGRIEDERLMSILYSAADAFVIPSLEDNFPNTVLEALMCGTPVIGFPTGGIPDMIKDGFNGYLCSEISVQSLRGSLFKFLQSPDIFKAADIRQDAVCRYDQSVQAKAYISLYEEILDRAKTKIPV